jgi:hypothetical protein
VRGPAAVFEPADAVAAGELLRPHRTKLHALDRYDKTWPLSAEAPVGPAVLLHRVGKGRVLTLAVSPDWATASEHATVEARRLLVGAVRYLQPRPRVRISASATVQTVVTDDPRTRTLRIHCLGYASPPQTLAIPERPRVIPSPIEDAPIFRVRIECGSAPRSVEARGAATVLECRGGVIEALVNDVHEVIRIGY